MAEEWVVNHHDAPLVPQVTLYYEQARNMYERLQRIPPLTQRGALELTAYVHGEILCHPDAQAIGMHEDIATMLRIIEENPVGGYRYAGDHARANADIQFSAVVHDGTCMCYVPRDVVRDERLMVPAIKSTAEALSIIRRRVHTLPVPWRMVALHVKIHGPDQGLNLEDRDKGRIITEAVKWHGASSLQHASSRLRRDADYMLRICKMDADAVWFADLRLHHNVMFLVKYLLTIRSDAFRLFRNMRFSFSGREIFRMEMARQIALRREKFYAFAMGVRKPNREGTEGVNLAFAYIAEDSTLQIIKEFLAVPLCQKTENIAVTSTERHIVFDDPDLNAEKDEDDVGLWMRLFELYNDRADDVHGASS